MEPKKKINFFDKVIGGIKKWASTPKEITIPARNPDLVSPDPQDWKEQQSNLISPEPPKGWTPPKPQIATPMQPTIAKSSYVPNITVPGKNNEQFTLPPEKAQVLLNSFNDIGEATNAARVMVHPMENTRTQAEIARGLGNNFNIGENPEINMTAPTILQTSNNTYDTGMLRVNSGTLNEMLANPYWKQRLLEKGITNFNELQTDPQKNADAARIRLEYGNWDNEMKKIKHNPNWRHWYAAPKELRIK